MLLVNSFVIYGVFMTTSAHSLSGTPVVPGVAAGPVLHVHGEISSEAIARYGAQAVSVAAGMQLFDRPVRGVAAQRSRFGNVQSGRTK